MYCDTEDDLKQFINCRLVRNHALIDDDLWIRNGKIINPEPVFYDERIKSHERIDCKNAIIAPGYIDLQINGGYGVDFSYDTDTVAQGVEKVAWKLTYSGVTSFCPTIITSPPDIYRKVLPFIPKKTKGAGVIGVHLEGPFINIEKKGAHEAACIGDLTDGVDTLLSTYGSLDNVKIVTLAPEKDPKGEVTRYLSKQGVTVALGHSSGTLSHGEFAVKNGAKLITHLFNAMVPFHHRDPGLFGLLASDAVPKNQRIFYGLIADGVHTHPAALRIAQRVNPHGLILVTDAISALGLEDGIHHIGQQALEVREGRAFIAGTDTLCGSIAPLDVCVRNFQKSTDCSLVYAIETATLHPAQCLGIENSKGTLDFGSDADFIMLDDDLRVLSTWIDGSPIHL